MVTNERWTPRGQGSVPHGGELIDRRLPGEEASALAAAELPALALTPAEVADLRALATGAYSPLTGFMSAKEHQSCTESMRLPDGTLWPIPVCLGVHEGSGVSGDRLALRGPDGALLGVLQVDEVFERDLRAEAELVYGTTDPAHPGVARVLSSPRQAVSGPVRALVDPLDGPVGRHALTPAQTRAAFAERGWASVVGFQTRNPVHRAHEYLMKCALENCDGLLLHPLVGPTKDGDVPAEVRMRAYHAILEYFPAERVMLAALVAPMRYAGPREAVLHALVRKNYGCTHFVVGRDHAGVGSYYGTFEAQELISSLPSEDLGITPLRFDNAFHCRRCGGMATGRTCPHAATEHLTLSGTQVRAMLAAGELPPPEFSRPEVARILTDAYQRQAR
ncbi:MAG TPA: sulfate adenylyltransferase [Actinomycetes bacterium]|jgi:ATP sulfurylase|nr:sulfate adenylyltransferase [Actinomycetes bacterium]